MSYQESIRDALRKLKEYYALRATDSGKDSDDITIKVLCYLLHIIETKCLNFSGYPYDIAYLGAIAEFITSYSSLGNGEHSQHFSRLSQVYSSLQQAKQKLEKHKEALSVKETVTALRTNCVDHSDQLIRTLVKMVVKKEDVDLANTVNHDELEVGIVRKQYIHSEVRGFVWRSDGKIDLPNSIFKVWIQNSAKYYLSSQVIDTAKNRESAPTYEDFFVFVHQAETFLKTKNLPAKDPVTKKFNKDMHEHLGLIADVFKNSGNFLSTVYDPSSDKFVLVHDEAQLVDRVRVVANFAKLIDVVISLQYLCMRVEKSIEMLGDIEFINPLHFHKIFSSIFQLCALVQESSKQCLDDFTRLQQLNKDHMQTAAKELFPNQVSRLVQSLSLIVERGKEDIDKCRKRSKGAAEAQTAQAERYELYEVTQAVLRRYYKEPETGKPTLKPVVIPVPATVTIAEPVVINPETTRPNSPKPIVRPAPCETHANIPEVEPGSREELIQLNRGIYKKISAIAATEKSSIQPYLKIYDSLIVMQDKAIALEDEENKTAERAKKAVKTFEITLDLAKKTDEFFSKTAQERKQGATLFAAEMHNILNSAENNEIIDSHYNTLSRFIYTHLCRFSLFKTDTRKKFTEVDEACTRITLV